MRDSFLQQAEEGNKTALLKRQIIGLYITEGDFSITDLSREMNLSVPTTTKLVGELIEEGYVHDFGKQGANGGRRPNIYGLNPYAGYFVGVDIKKDTISMSMINFKGSVISYSESVVFALENSKQSLDALCGQIRAFITQSKIQKNKVLAIGINLSGRVNSQTGYSYSYLFMEEMPLTMFMEQQLGCAVYIENDTRAMTFGEYMCGVANNEKTMLFVNASWGLGVGIVIDGKLFYGKSGFSGEFGHFPLLDNDVICRCGKQGCLETGASGSAVHRLFLEKLQQKRASMLSDKYNRGEDITLEDILSALAQEDVLAIEVMETVGHTLGKAIAGLINLFNPELIVIGGTLSVAKDYLMLPLKSSINKHSLQLVSKDTTIKLSKLGERAGVSGACMLIRSRMLGLM
ncbi:MAG: ROK family transcriptional regulator [Alistipes sp.]